MSGLPLADWSLLTLIVLSAFLYYDHALTFSEEVRRIWRAPLSKGSLWFLLNRYLAFFGMGTLVPNYNDEEPDLMTILGNLAILFVTFTNWVAATKVRDPLCTL